MDIITKDTRDSEPVVFTHCQTGTSGRIHVYRQRGVFGYTACGLSADGMHRFGTHASKATFQHTHAETTCDKCRARFAEGGR